MININDLLRYIDKVATKIKEMYIPSLLFKMHKLNTSISGIDQILIEIHDFSSHQIFQIHYCYYLIENNNFILALSILKQLVMIPLDQINRIY